MDVKERKKSIFTDVMDLAGLNEPLTSSRKVTIEKPSAAYRELTTPNDAVQHPFASFYAAAAAAQFDPFLANRMYLQRSINSHLLPFGDPLGRFTNPFFAHALHPAMALHPATGGVFMPSKAPSSATNNRAAAMAASSKFSQASMAKYQLKLPAHPPTSLSTLVQRTKGARGGGDTNVGGDGALSSTSSVTPAAPTSARQTAPRFQCPDCNRSYSTFSGLSKHRQFHCASQLKRQFGCKFCEKQYSSLGALKMHIRTHTLPCKCQICGKAFSRPWLLQGHLRTHTGEKPFRCCHCGRAFADRSNLRAHLQTHSEIKKYQCASCQKTFSRMSLLSKHETNGCPAAAAGHRGIAVVSD